MDQSPPPRERESRFGSASILGIQNGWHREGLGRGREVDVSGAGEACVGRLFWRVRSVLAWYTTPPPEMEQSVKVM